MYDRNMLPMVNHCGSSYMATSLEMGIDATVLLVRMCLYRMHSLLYILNFQFSRHYNRTHEYLQFINLSMTLILKGKTHTYLYL